MWLIWTCLFNSSHVTICTLQHCDNRFLSSTTSNLNKYIPSHECESNTKWFSPSAYKPPDSCLNLVTQSCTTAAFSSKMPLGGEMVHVGGKYRLGKHISSGSFGMLYNLIFFTIISIIFRNHLPWNQYHVKAGSHYQAGAYNAEHLQLENEMDIYKSLTGGPGIPSLYWFRAKNECNAMVLEHLGPSL